MNRTIIAVIASVLAMAAILAGTFWVFFALAAQIPAGRTLGMLSAALMVVSGLAWLALASAT